ncbi:MAG TPA: T9SS type A sorting domain-containing protein [Flavobacteriales bacterium]|nr:T9SS type A sorting domain-containing protein [Flavobacteriales bacterium]
MNKLLLALLCLPFLAFGQVQLKPSIGIGALPNDSDPVCTIVPRTQGNPWTPIAAGDTAADFNLYDINGVAMDLASILNSGKFVLMVAGSYTCPIFRNHMTELNAVAAQYGNQIECFVVYEVEAHPDGSPMPSSGQLNPTNPKYPQPTTYGERKANLQDMLDGVGTGSYVPVPVNIPIYIDGPCNEWWDYYDGPNKAYLIDTNGVIFAYHDWFSNSNPPNSQATNIWCDIDSLLGVNSGGCSQVTSLNGTFDFQLKSMSSDTTYGSPGAIIDIFGELINTSSEGVKVEIRRFMEDLPDTVKWESSICVTFCLPPDEDTTSVIIAAGDTVDFSFHFFTDASMPGPDTGRARVRFKNMNGNQQSQIQNYIAITTEEITALIAEKEKISDVTLYPNPTAGLLTIFGVEGRVRIYDIYGNLVISAQTNTLNLADVTAGVYFVKITDKKGRVYSKKIMKD